MLLNLLVLTILTFATITGLVTLHTHQRYFSDFGVREIIDGRIDAILYVIVIVSTATCLVFGCLWVVWSMEEGWQLELGRWFFFTAMANAATGLVSAAFHIAINILLRVGPVCCLCRQTILSVIEK